MSNGRHRMAMGAAVVAATALLAVGCGRDVGREAVHATGIPADAALAAVAPAGGGPVAGGGHGSGVTTEHDITAPDGRTRHYRLHVPASVAATDERAPLVLALHGGFGWGEQFERQSGLDDLADANGFLVAYPDGNDLDLPGPGAVWNAGGCCGFAAADADDIDDVGFLAAVLDDVEAAHHVDPDRVFAAGHSNGAMMSLRLACELGDRIAAVAVQSGTLFVDGCTPARPVSVLALHGDADPNVPLEGGRGPKSRSDVDFPPPLEGMATLAAADGCDPDPSVTTPAAAPDVSVRTWEGCRAGTTVAFVTVHGAEHGWMGATGGSAARLTGVESYPGLDTSVAVWSFLSTHGR